MSPQHNRERQSPAAFGCQPSATRLRANPEFQIPISKIQNTLFVPFLILALIVSPGCGTTKQAEATLQLLSSDAIDRSIARIDFSPLKGQTVFLETKYIVDPKITNFVNANYVISSLRQQLYAAGCLIQEKAEEADYVVEARIGTLGNDENSIIYGVPANNALSAASTILPSAPPIPAMPEISIARKDAKMAAAKIAAFAYERKTHQVVWQSGLSVAKSTSRDTWVLGAGPFGRSTADDGWQFAGSKVRLPFMKRKQPMTGAVAAYGQEMLFRRPTSKEEDKPSDGKDAAKPASGIQQASAEQVKPDAASTAPVAAASATTPAPPVTPAAAPAGTATVNTAPAATPQPPAPPPSANGAK
ncbi:MAG: DUF6655 family protein [Planctomycetaceae bacterium]